jgi:TRAP-type C4-dicarboxylate transport system permease small subunit
MKALSNGISIIEKYISIVLMFSMAVIVTLAVFFRYLLNAPLFWAGEVSIFLLIWVSFIGGSLGLKYKSQAAVTIALDYVPLKVKRIILVTGHVFMLAFLFLIIYYSYVWVFSPSVAFQRSTSLLMPMWIPYLIVPVGLTFASIHLIANMIDVIKGDVAQ